MYYACSISGPEFWGPNWDPLRKKKNNSISIIFMQPAGEYLGRVWAVLAPSHKKKN